jgi:sodium-dependent dicarboxylate transporter 2/3/5
MSEEARRAAVIAALMAFWWVSEPIPLAATALLPIAAFPLAGIANLETTAQSYAHPLILLFLGGFMLAAAMERWQLHRRIALGAVVVSGRKPRALVLAMMLATAFVSLWVSNTATAMVMVPIAASLLSARRSEQTGSSNGEAHPHACGEARQEEDAFGAALILGIAFSATIGGMGTLIGTPPNALFAAVMEKSYGVSIGFGQWMLIGLPIVLVLIPITWLVLTRIAFRVPDAELPAAAFPAAPETMSRGERFVAVVLAATAVAWIFRPWLSKLLGTAALSDAGIAITAALVLFLMPERWVGSRALLEWDDVKGIRWDVLILFGGGLALADAIGSSGLADWIGSRVGGLRGLPVAGLVLVMMVVVVYLGELASNTAVAAMFLPIAGAASYGLGAHPLDLALPVALAASLGFMLPVATPPNAIAYGTGAVTARQMLRAGAILDVISIFVVYAAAMTLGPVIFGLKALRAY